jgi:L-alanine-DL-glutamate epimerase-like enolase superfamily enzyme
VHIAAAAKDVIAVERYGCDLEADLFDDAITPDHGWITVPDAPGLGIEPSPAVMARFG